MVNPQELITNWLIEEGFEVKKLTVMPPIKILWGLDVFTPPPLRVNLKIFKPENRNDRVIILLGVGISPEHRAALSKLTEEQRLKFSSKLLSRILSVCNICTVAIQPNPVNPQAVSVGTTVFDVEITDTFKPRFTERISLLINSFLTIVSTFNEEFPVIPKGKSHESTTTRM